MEDVQETVLVTGSTGLLGLSTVDSLLAGGYRIIAAARSREKAQRVLPNDERVEILIGDLTAPEALLAALPRCQAVVHCAAYFREYFARGEHGDQLQKLNVAFPARLAQAADAAGVKTTVMVSSTGVYSLLPPGQLSDEDSPKDAQIKGNGYQESKVAMEKELAKVRLRPDHRMVIVRPGWMWGPKDYAPTATGQLATDLMKRGSFQMPMGRAFGIVDARDVAEGIAACIDQPGAAGPYNLAGHNMTALDALAAVAKADGRGKVTSIPLGLAYGLSGFLEFITRPLGLRNPVPREGVQVISTGGEIDSSKAQRELGVTFRPFAETARDTAAFIRKEFLKS